MLKCADFMTCFAWMCIFVATLDWSEIMDGYNIADIMVGDLRRTNFVRK